jgi:sugar (pentulose or hexulose) kinase
MTHAKRALALLLAVFAVVGVAACGSDDSTTSTGTITTNEKATTQEESKKPATPTIVVRNGEPVGGIQELEYNAGDEVRFRVSSNQADEVHIHGYDIEEEIPAGGSATLSFPADIEGIFEVELHGSETQIAELRVNP